MGDTLCITIAATKSYAYAMRSQARLVAANVSALPAGHLILATDGSEELQSIAAYYQEVLPEGWNIHTAADTALQEHPNYKAKAQLVIARLRTMAFALARKLQASHCWSLDSDTLPPANAYRCLRHMLDFDAGYYSISTCSYPNEAFLGGRGTEQSNIAEDFYEDERQLSDNLKTLLKRVRSEIEKAHTNQPPNSLQPKDLTRYQSILNRLGKWVKASPPIGNVFACNAKAWRPRGWLEHAYPAIGKGAVVPSDWCGFGCTLMNAEALAHAHFEGYQGQGTEDLFIVWKQWRQMGLRINVITHVVCDHVINGRKKGAAEDAYTHIRAFHETQGECIGHIRTEKVPWLYD